MASIIRPGWLVAIPKNHPAVDIGRVIELDDDVATVYLGDGEQQRVHVEDLLSVSNHARFDQLSEPHKRTVLMVDTENIANIGIMKAYGLEEGDECVMFYTDHNEQIYQNTMSHASMLSCKLTYVHCFLMRRDALDFQLATYLGAEVEKARANGTPTRFRILSNDTGFNACVTYWKSQGEDIETITYKPIAPDAPKKLRPGQQLTIPRD